MNTGILNIKGGSHITDKPYKAKFGIQTGPMEHYIHATIRHMFQPIPPFLSVSAPFCPLSAFISCRSSSAFISQDSDPSLLPSDSQ